MVPVSMKGKMVVRRGVKLVYAAGTEQGRKKGNSYDRLRTHLSLDRLFTGGSVLFADACFRVVLTFRRSVPVSDPLGVVYVVLCRKPHDGVS